MEPVEDCALNLKIKDIVNADNEQIENWVMTLIDHVNRVMTEDNSAHTRGAVGKSQIAVWVDCFTFIAETLAGLSSDKQEYNLIFEYSMPGTDHKRPDILLLTEKKVVSLEFKKKDAPQVDSNKDDVAQANYYDEWLKHHHEVTKEKNMQIESYIVCTAKNAVSGMLRGITILTRSNFCNAIDSLLTDQKLCSFVEEWLASPKTEMPDQIRSIEIMYSEGEIPYIDDVNKNCLDAVLNYINKAKSEKKKILILINGVPGAGKTAIGQCTVFEENQNGEANAVYLSGNGPLVEVIQYQINQVGNDEYLAENVIQGMKEFKSTYFFSNKRTPQQSVLVFDEAQRAWDANKVGKGFSEPEGLFRVGERIFNERGYAVLIGLYGNGQAIYIGEEDGISLWEDALKEHNDWSVIASEEIAAQISGVGTRKIVDDNVFLPVSIRADFIDCSKWVEQAIRMKDATFAQAESELKELQNTSLQILLTRDFSKVLDRTAEMDSDHPDWKYGILISNFAESHVIRKVLPGWDISYNGANVVSNGQYGPWFTGGCNNLDKACTVYGIQGLELDCPIVVFGGEYIRQNGKWLPRGYKYNDSVRKKKYKRPDLIVENNFRVLLTRARKEMILVIPEDPILDETYDYFAQMGMDLL